MTKSDIQQRLPVISSNHQVETKAAIIYEDEVIASQEFRHASPLPVFNNQIKFCKKLMFLDIKI